MDISISLVWDVLDYFSYFSFSLGDFHVIFKLPFLLLQLFIHAAFRIPKIIFVLLEIVRTEKAEVNFVNSFMQRTLMPFPEFNWQSSYTQAPP